MPLQRKILIVEDNDINRELLCAILAPTYQVLQARNGEEALDVLRQYGQDISLILLDILMPVMDGYTFLSRIKEDSQYASIPVIVTTQSDSEEDEVTALANGATDFVAKPYRPKIILHRVANIIRLRETAAMINLVQHDQLTGLYTKAFFCQRAEELLQQNPQQDYDVICSDLVHFKLINDIFGMAMGDRLLQAMAGLVASLCGDSGLCGRFGADLFVCLVKRPPSGYSDEMFMAMTGQLSRITQIKSITIHWGIYPVVDRTIPVELMCERALLTARSIKPQYGHCHATYDDHLRSQLLREREIADTMAFSLAQGQFEIYLQPKYRIVDDMLSGAEALIRWNHPEWGLQSPGEFIPIFERNGFITQLDQFVWEQVCQLLRQWDDLAYPPLPISVNVSRADIYNADLPDLLTALIEKYQLTADRLHLEITESAYTENPTQIINTVSRLRELGFVIEMDDFGSGYSSLNMLNQMPLDILKLDMKFIRSETSKPINQGILRFIMDLARWMHLQVVAEGVETREQLYYLREIGCDFVQGYYFARPMPVDDFKALVEQQHPDLRQAEPAPHPDMLQRQLLLVVDEDEHYRQAVADTFSYRFQVVQAVTAEEALACIRRDRSRLAAVVLSITLPQGASRQIMTAIQQEKANWMIPVVATAPWDMEKEAAALSAGADDFAGKPHTQAALKCRLLRVIGANATRERECSLQDEACRDYLTGLYNRRGLAVAASLLQKEDGPLAIYLFDLDNMKQFNDSFGHPQGDQLLIRFSQLLCAHTRRSDIIARFGGDEFVVIAKRLGSPEVALRKGNEICQATRSQIQIENVVAGCTAGVVICEADAPIADMISRADEALYQAKAAGKGRCLLWTETLDFPLPE